MLTSNKITIISDIPQKRKKYYFPKFKINKSIFGPEQRLNYLLLGLKQQKYPFNFNPCLKKVARAVHVISGHKALEWAIQAKQSKVIDYLLAGPNIVAHPSEYGGIIKDSNIDIVINASSWVSEMFQYYAPELKNRTKEWFSGVDHNKWRPAKDKTNKSIQVLVYDKAYLEMWNGYSTEEDNSITKNIIKYLAEKKIKYHIIRYKFYKQNKYLKLLQNSQMMIYLSRQETQSQALFEAWSCDVPTLVWNRNLWSYNNYCFRPASSAPYLNSNLGLFFGNFKEFLVMFPDFLKLVSSSFFSPRDYVRKNFTLNIATKKYLDIWLELFNKNKYA